MANRKSSLSYSQRNLVELMQKLNFGRIEDLHIRNGEPQANPPPRLIHEFKFGGNNGARSETTKLDFVLKAEVIALLAQLEAIGNGIITRIEVKHGLPFRMIFEEL